MSRIDKRFNLDLIQEKVNSPIKSIVLFGSYARGDMTEASDIDILVVTEDVCKSFSFMDYSVATYTKTQLLKMAEQSSLFILHLISEARMLEGENIIDELRSKFVRVSSYESYREDLRHASDLLDININIYKKYHLKMIKLQQYLLRSFIYSKNWDNGCQLFSMIHNLQLIGKEEYAESFFNKKARVNFDEYVNRNRELELLFEHEIANEYGSIEALVVNSYYDYQLTKILGLRILKLDNPDLDYENIIISNE